MDIAVTIALIFIIALGVPAGLVIALQRRRQDHEERTASIPVPTYPQFVRARAPIPEMDTAAVLYRQHRDEWGLR